MLRDFRRFVAMLALIAAPAAGAAKDAGPPAGYIPDPAPPETFATPSGNIRCDLSDPYADEPESQNVTCVIFKYSSGGTLDCGAPQAIAISLAGNGGVITTCIPDLRGEERVPVLDYGRSISTGTITCRSENSGLICQTEQGHGFKLSRTRVRIF